MTQPRPKYYTVPIKYRARRDGFCRWEINNPNDHGIVYFRYAFPQTPKLVRTVDPPPDIEHPDVYDRMTAEEFKKRGKRGVIKIRRRRKRKLMAFLASESKSLGETYKSYMQSSKWKFFRKTIIEQRGASCERCGKINCVLHIHHISYVRLGNEHPSDVKVYCADCHKLMHSGWSGSGVR